MTSQDSQVNRNITSASSHNLDEHQPESFEPLVEEDATLTLTPTNDPSIPFSGSEDMELDTTHLKSTVWTHYKRKREIGAIKAVCKYCSKSFTAASKLGTNHLHRHANNCAKRTNIDIRQQVLISQQSKVDGKAALNTHSFDQDSLRKHLARMIVMHEYPLSMVSHLGFQIFVSHAQPLFKMVSRNTIKSDILKMYALEKQKLMRRVEKNRGRIALTTDMWSTPNQTRGFMVITAHYVDDSWNLQSHIIRFAYVRSPHTKVVLADVLLECCLEWNIDRKIATLTVDNCATNDAMVRLVLSKLQHDKLMLCGDLFHMRCAVHILNLIVQEGLLVIKEGIEHIRASVLFWTASTKRRQKFEETTRQLEIKCRKELALDCKTRWNSTYYMLATALEYKDVFFRLKQRDSTYDCNPSDREWEEAQDICEKLELFHNATELFSGTRYPTANIYFNKVCEIRIALGEWYITTSSSMIKTMAHRMFEKFSSYWKIINEIIGVAAVLDPRYKMVAVLFYFNSIYGSEADQEIKKVRDMCYELVKEYGNDSIGHESSASNTLSVTQSSMKKHSSKFDEFVSSRKKDVVGSAKLELDFYLEDDVLPTSDDFDVLYWWKVNGPKYPTLQKIARDVLAIPVSTVASESAFSTSGRLLSPHRSKLASKTLEALMCTQNWIWNEIKGSSPKGMAHLEATFQSFLDEFDDGDEDESIVISGEDDDTIGN